jgi:hypothetical protein
VFTSKTEIGVVADSVAGVPIDEVLGVTNDTVECLGDTLFGKTLMGQNIVGDMWGCVPVKVFNEVNECWVIIEEPNKIIGVSVVFV